MKWFVAAWIVNAVLLTAFLPVPVVPWARPALSGACALTLAVIVLLTWWREGRQGDVPRARCQTRGQARVAGRRFRGAGERAGRAG